MDRMTWDEVKEKFEEINGWNKENQKALKKALKKWVNEETPSERSNRKTRERRHAAKIANGGVSKKETVKLTPEEAAAKEAAAKERKRETDRAYKERKKEQKALQIANGGVSKKETVKLTPEEAAAKKAAAKERKRETDKAYKERKKEQKALQIANGGVSKKETVKLTPEQAAAKKAADNERKRENAKKLKECIRGEKNEIEELVINSGVLNQLVHLMVKKIKEEDTEIDTVLMRDLFGMAEEDHIKHEAIECLRREGVKTFRYFRRDQIFESWVSAKIRCFNQTKIVDTDFMNTNFPISDPRVYNQQVVSDASAGCDVSANPSAHGDNVSDSSCDSDEDEHLSDVDEDEHLSDVDEDEQLPDVDEDEQLSDVGSDSGCESDGDRIVVTPGAGGSYSKDKSPLNTPGTPPTPRNPPTPRTPVTPGGPYSRCDSDEDEHLSDVGSDGGSDLEVANQDEDEHLSDVGSDGGSDSEDESRSVSRSPLAW